MDVEPTADQQAFARQAIAMGRVPGEEEIVSEALALWERRERTRFEILAALDTAERSLARGEGHIVTEQATLDLADGVKRRGRTRLATLSASNG